MITGKIARKWMAHFINAGVGEESNYVRLGTDLEEYTIEMNANVNTTQNILGEASTVVDGYEPQASVEPYYAEVGEPLYERLQKIADERLTHDDLKTSVIEVRLWEEDEVGTDTFVAYKEDAVIEVVSYGGDTSGVQIPFNLYHIGNRVKGKFDLTTKTFTPDAPIA